MREIRLPIGRTLLAASRAPLVLGLDSWIVVAAPAVVLLGAALLSAWLQQRSAPVSMVLISYLASLAAVAKLAVTFQRCILLPTAYTNTGGHFWGWRESRYLITLVGLSLCLFILPILLLRYALPAITTLLAAVNSPTSWLTTTAAGVFGVLILAAGAYVPARLAPVLPAIAVDQRRPFSKTWELSRGNGLRLLLVAFAFPGLVHISLELTASLIPGSLNVILNAYIALVDLAILALAYGVLADPPLPTKSPHHPTVEQKTYGKRLTFGLAGIVLLAATAALLERAIDSEGLGRLFVAGSRLSDVGERAATVSPSRAPEAIKNREAEVDQIKFFAEQGQFFTLSKSRVALRFVVGWRVDDPTAFARTLNGDSNQVRYRLSHRAADLLRSRMSRLRDTDLHEHLPTGGVESSQDDLMSTNTNPLVAGIPTELSEKTQMMGIQVVRWRVEPAP